MFDIGWSEMLVIAVVMIVVVGPKDLPRMLRAFGKMTTKFRAMAGDFQKQFNDAMKEAELDDIRRSIDTLRDLDPRATIRKQLNPFEQAATDIRSELDALKPSVAPSVEAQAHPAEPLKAGPTGLPGEDAPDPDVKEKAKAPAKAKAPVKAKRNNGKAAVDEAAGGAAKPVAKPQSATKKAVRGKAASAVKPAGSEK